MITKDEIQSLLHSTETYRIERTVSTGNMDKFCEAICAFANDLPDSRKKGLYQFDDHIEIMNAGGLYGEARPENFPMVNDYRNPIVAEAMKEMKYVNMFNQGVIRVQDMLREIGNREAVFDVSKLTVFCVNVFSNEDSITQTTTQTTTQTLSDVQIAIIEYIHTHPHASRKEIAANINDITENGIKYHLKKLQEKGIIKRVGADFGGHWVVNDP